VSSTGVAVLIVLAGAAGAESQDVHGHVAAELRLFPSDPAHSRQPDTYNFSFATELAYERGIGDGLVFRGIAFGRVDEHDPERSRVDLNQAVLQFTRDALAVDVGVHTVFWGVTESRHLVDIVNQIDELEWIGSDRRLGQLMARASYHIGRFGSVELLGATAFRPRRYPGPRGRPGVPAEVRYGDTEYEAGLGRWHPDVAVRWSHAVGELSGAASVFVGTAREPELIPGGTGEPPVLQPQYALIRQGGLELQWTHGDWLWKGEAIVREGQGAAFAAVTFGFERTIYGVLGSTSDLAVFLEYSHDGRENLTLNIHDSDLFGGLRLLMNDFAGTEVSGGALTDVDSGATFAVMEATRRFGQRWTIELLAQLFSASDPPDPLYWFRRDDHLQTTARFFF